MKKFTLFLAALCCTVMANAWNLQVDGICYNVNWNDYTATVTYETQDADNYKNLSGAITIPAIVYGDTKPFKVIAIGDSAFNCAKNITSVSIGSNVTAIKRHAFANCKALTSISIPDKVTSLGVYAFAWCYALTSVTIGSGLKDIGSDAFMWDTKLVYYQVTSSNPYFSSLDGVLCNKDKTKLILYPNAKADTYTIPDGITEIAQIAFYSCSDLKSVTIPDGVTKLGNWAFGYCTRLTTVTLGSGVTDIGGSAFRDCSNLTSFTCMATTPPILGNNVFQNVDCSQIPLYVPATSVNAYKVAEQWKEFNPIQAVNPSEGIEEPTSDSSLKGRGQKVIKDGQLLIERNGKTYNALGAELK